MLDGSFRSVSRDPHPHAIPLLYATSVYVIQGVHTQHSSHQVLQQTATCEFHPAMVALDSIRLSETLF